MADEDHFEDAEELAHWESEALGKVRGILYDAQFDNEEGTVTLECEDWDPTGKGDFGSRTFDSLEDLRSELVEIGDSEMIGHVPWENGPVFPTESDDLVDMALEESGMPDFFRSLEVPKQSELLLSLDDLSKEDPHEIQIQMEEVNDLLIKHLADNPSMMREMNSRKFEELVAELFRRMEYEVVLTPPAKDGGRDLLAFQKKGIGTLLTLVECKRFTPEHKVGVGLVRSLYGVVEHERATHGVIATTSSFTRGARQFQQNLRYRMSLSDFDDLAQWCHKYRDT